MRASRSGLYRPLWSVVLIRGFKRRRGGRGLEVTVLQYLDRCREKPYTEQLPSDSPDTVDVFTCRYQANACSLSRTLHSNSCTRYNIFWPFCRRLCTRWGYLTEFGEGQCLCLIQISLSFHVSFQNFTEKTRLRYYHVWVTLCKLFKFCAVINLQQNWNFRRYSL